MLASTCLSVSFFPLTATTVTHGFFFFVSGVPGKGSRRPPRHMPGGLVLHARLGDDGDGDRAGELSRRHA
nr:unnamed protein product [Digitaria exilis]